jgi:type II secretory pathway pseudopilin PulG
MLRRKKSQGFTLIGALAAALVLSILATFIGKNLFYLIKSRMRSEAKVSIVDNESTFTELIAAKIFTMANSNACTIANFASTFNTNPPTFPGGLVTVRIENPTLNEFGLSGTPASFQADFKTAIASCVTKPILPLKKVDNTWTGTFLFCAKVNNPVDRKARKDQTGFLNSPAAFAEIRIDLSREEVSQVDKVLGDALPCNTWVPPASGSADPDTRQMKLSYRIFWKRSNGNSDLDYFSKMDSKIINVSELRTN